MASFFILACWRSDVPKFEVPAFTGFRCPNPSKTAWDSGTWDNGPNKYLDYKNKNDLVKTGSRSGRPLVSTTCVSGWLERRTTKYTKEHETHNIIRNP